jgi:hypothetical protein
VLAGLAALLWLGAVIRASGAAVTLESLDPVYFKTNGMAPHSVLLNTPIWPPGSSGGGLWATNDTQLYPTNAPGTGLIRIHQFGNLAIGTDGAIADNWGTPDFGDALLIEYNGDAGGNPSRATLDIENVNNVNFDASGVFTVQALTNSVLIRAGAETASGSDSVLMWPRPDNGADYPIIDVQGQSQNFGDIQLWASGAITANGGTNAFSSKWAFGAQTAPAGVTNLTVVVDGQRYRIIAIPY